jgi:hypothetical protein
MSATRESTVSTSVSTSTGEAGGGDDTFSQTSYSSETTVYLGDPSGQDGGGLGLGVQADATAFGTDTLALLDVSATVSDGIYVDSASASVEAIAAAQSPDDSAFALANVLIDVYGDADVYLGISHSATYTAVDETGTTTVSEVSASVHALDFSTGGSVDAGQAPAEYSPETQPVAEEPLLPYLPPDCGCGGPEPDEGLDFGFDVDIDGNLSVFDIEANAFGQDTLADVSVDAFVVEDQVSTVTAVVVVAIG